MLPRVTKLVNDVFKTVEGCMADIDGQLLYDLAKDVKSGVIVEIGAMYGKSTICLALGSKVGHNIPVYSIDPRTGQLYTIDSDWIKCGDPNGIGAPEAKYYTEQSMGYSEFYDNIKKWHVDDIVIPICDYSELAYKSGLNGREWNKDIGLLWIDGDHRYNYVKLDIELWVKHVISGGSIVFHDYAFAGVNKAIKELVTENHKYHISRCAGMCLVISVTTT